MNNMDLSSKLSSYEDFLAYASMGSGQLFAHPLVKGFHFTEGARFVAQTFGAYWLIDAIASHQPSVKRELEKHGLRDFQVWRLQELDGKIVLDAWSDTPDAEGSKCLAAQIINYTDFPVELFPYVDLWVEYGTLLLKQER